METESSLEGLDHITQPRTWGVFWRRGNGGGGVCCWYLDGPWQVGKLNHWMVYLQLNYSNHCPQSSGVTGQGEPEWWGTGTYGHLEIRYNSHAPQIQSRGSKMKEKEQDDQVQELRGPHRLVGAVTGPHDPRPTEEQRCDFRANSTQNPSWDPDTHSNCC